MPASEDEIANARSEHLTNEVWSDVCRSMWADLPRYELEVGLASAYLRARGLHRANKVLLAGLAKIANELLHEVNEEHDK